MNEVKGFKKTVVKFGSSSAHIVCPKKLIGEDVIVIPVNEIRDTSEE
jgi:putative transposon-encoded protein